MVRLLMCARLRDALDALIEACRSVELLRHSARAHHARRERRVDRRADVSFVLPAALHRWARA